MAPFETCRKCIRAMQNPRLLNAASTPSWRRSNENADQLERNSDMAVYEANSAQTAPMATRLIGLGHTTISAIATWHNRRATRKALAQLSDHELADIGLDRGLIDQI